MTTNAKIASGVEMNREEMVFNLFYHKETMYLQVAWLAHKSECPVERDKAFDNASRVRPVIEKDPRSGCLCDTMKDKPCPVHGKNYKFDGLF